MSDRINIIIITAALPPQLDGIGDYTANLSAELAKTSSVSILTAVSVRPAPIAGVSIEPSFSVARPGSVRCIIPLVQANRPDWILLQYQPFAYGRWGLNLQLPLAIRAAKRSAPGTKFALMVHEPFVPILDWKHALMAVWQRWQLWALGRAADVVLFSIEPWVRQFRGWFPDKPLVHLPVGSNVPRVPMTRSEARARLGIGDDTAVLGFFGTAHNARLPGWVKSAARAVTQTGRAVQVLYIGPHKEAMCQALDGLPVIADGALPAEEVSRRFATMDVFLAPFTDGVSTRRTSLMTALQHGVATVGTRGASTDDVLAAESNWPLLLADVDKPEDFIEHVVRLLTDDTLRERIGHEGKRLYQAKFTWEHIAARLLDVLRQPGRGIEC